MELGWINDEIKPNMLLGQKIIIENAIEIFNFIINE